MPENEITSAQIVFPDNRTLDEVYEDIMSKIGNLQKNVDELKAATE